MRILPPVEEEIRRSIREMRARDPLITVSKLRDALADKFNKGISRKYVAKLADKVARQSLIEIDRMKIEERLEFTRQNYRMMREELLKIVYWHPDTATPGVPKPLARDRIEAAKNVVMLDLALLQAEIANGMYKKPIEMLAKEIHYEPLPGEIRTVIIASWARGGLLPAAAIEKMVPLQEYANTNGSAA